MRILYLSTGLFYKGGIARYSRYQVEALRRIMGPENVRVLSMMGRGPDDFEGEFQADWSGPAKEPRLRGRVAFVLAGFRSFFDRPGRPDTVVWVNHVNYGPIGWVLRTCGARAYIVNTYGLELWSGMRPHRRAALFRADHVVVDCHFSRDYIVQENMAPEDRTSVVWDLVDTERFSPGPASAEALQRYGVAVRPDRFRIITVGRLNVGSRHKGVERNIRMLSGLDPGLPVDLVVVGDGDDRPRLEALAAQLGVRERVFFAGSVPDQDLPDLYRSCHLSMLVSDRGKNRGEGIPLTPLEAAACGLPIIVGNQDGSREAVVQGVNGWCLDPFDLACQRAAVERLARDPALRERMGRAARERILQEHAFDVFVERTRTALQRVLPEPQS